MAYVRMGQDASDVYVYPTEVGDRRVIECVTCSFTAHSTECAVVHLREHIAEGDTVPDYVIPQVEAGRFCETGNPL